jgi:hypothetical protein
MIPQEKIEAVTRGLCEAFGVTTFEDIQNLTKGRSTALVLRIVVRGTPFLLRIIMRADDPTRHFACMRAAAEAGLAPRVWYTSVEDRISITDFVEAVPFPITEALVQMPRVLRAVHALPPFSGVENRLNTTCMFLLNEGPAREGFLRAIRTGNFFCKDESEELFTRYAQVAAVYPCGSEMVSSHNDLFKPDNILFDGRRVQLVDWEAAFLNDRYAELAVVANLVATSEAEERVYLQEYFGQEPNSYQRARFFLMQQVAHMFYAMVFLMQSASGKPVIESGNAPDSREFHRRFWTGEVDLEGNPMKNVYGRLHLEQLLQNTRDARFDEALKTVSERPAGP